MYGIAPLTRALIDAKCKNPVIYIKGLEKIPESLKLELLKQINNLLIQEKKFRDPYLGIDIDLSEVKFIFSATDNSNINGGDTYECNKQNLQEQMHGFKFKDFEPWTMQKKLDVLKHPEGISPEDFQLAVAGIHGYTEVEKIKPVERDVDGIIKFPKYVHNYGQTLMAYIRRNGCEAQGEIKRFYIRKTHYFSPLPNEFDLETREAFHKNVNDFWINQIIGKYNLQDGSIKIESQNQFGKPQLKAFSANGPCGGGAYIVAKLSALAEVPVPVGTCISVSVNFEENLEGVGAVCTKLQAAYANGVKNFIVHEDNRKEIEDTIPECFRDGSRGLTVTFIKDIEGLMIAAFGKSGCLDILKKLSHPRAFCSSDNCDEDYSSATHKEKKPPIFEKSRKIRTTYGRKKYALLQRENKALRSELEEFQKVEEAIRILTKTGKGRLLKKYFS